MREPRTGHLPAFPLRQISPTNRQRRPRSELPIFGKNHHHGGTHAISCHKADLCETDFRETDFATIHFSARLSLALGESHRSAEKNSVLPNENRISRSTITAIFMPDGRTTGENGGRHV